MKKEFIIFIIPQLFFFCQIDQLKNTRGGGCARAPFNVWRINLKGRHICPD